MSKETGTRMHQETLRIGSRGRGLIEITAEVRRVVKEAGISTGLCVIYCRHTSCSLVIQENADPSARVDLEAWFERLAPEDDAAYTHNAEGPDDMPSHLRSAVTSTSECVPIMDGELALGTWQGVFLAEHRNTPHRRTIVVHLTGA